MTASHPRTRYLIAGYQRSGTTVLHLLIGGHPQVSALNDEMSIAPFFTHGLGAFTIGNHLSDAERKNGYRLLFDAITGADATASTTAWGAKVACGSPAAARKIADTVRNHLPELKIVLVSRTDLVAQLGSTLQRRKTGIAHSWYTGWSNARTEKVKINRVMLAGYVIGVLDTLAEFRTLRESNDLFEVSYEEFAADNDRAYRNILQFLDLPYAEASWLQSKKVLPQPAEYISNYDEATSLLTRVREAYVDNAIPRYVEVGLKVYRRAHKMVYGRRSNARARPR